MGVPLQNRFSIEYPGSFLQVDDQGRLVLASGASVSLSGTPATERETVKPTFTIPINTSTSDAVNFDGLAGGKLFIPVGMQGVIHFESSPDNVTWYPALDEYGTALTVTQVATPSTVVLSYCIPDKASFGGGYIRLRTYTDQTRTTAQNQSAARTILVSLSA